MGQGEVLEVLERKKVFMSAQEVADVLGQQRTSVCTILSKLYKQDLVIRVVPNIRTGGYKWQIKEDTDKCRSAKSGGKDV